VVVCMSEVCTAAAKLQQASRAVGLVQWWLFESGHC
jgi:hypothetical protein